MHSNRSKYSYSTIVVQQFAILVFVFLYFVLYHLINKDKFIPDPAATSTLTEETMASVIDLLANDICGLTVGYAGQ